MIRQKVLQFPVVLTIHVFDKIRSIDMALGEFAQLLGTGEVLEEYTLPGDQLHELVLISEWTRPLHVVFIVDEQHAEERVITVYEPETEQWSQDFRRRLR